MSYPSDLSEAQWALIEPVITAWKDRQNLHLAAPRDQFLRLLELTGPRDLFGVDPVPLF